MPRGQARCELHSRAKEQERAADPIRAKSQALYQTPRWKAARLRFLAANPLCAECQRQGRVTPAFVVDHRVPHLGNEEAFWNESNWEPLCDYRTPFNCHGKKTAREARSRRG